MADKQRFIYLAALDSASLAEPTQLCHEALSMKLLTTRDSYSMNVYMSYNMDVVC